MVEYGVHETGFDPNGLAAFAARLHRVARDDVRLEIRTIRGGPQATRVARVVARAGGAADGCASFVVKRLEARAVREADAYRALGELGASDLVPRCLGVERLGSGQFYLYLEHVVRPRAWPWGAEELAGQVLEPLAWLHASFTPQGPFASSAYEKEITQSAASTVDMFEVAVREPHVARLARMGRHLRRIVAWLPSIRRGLLTHESVVLHGDVNPGNVLVRRRRGRLETVFIDWERARLGSPMEDVASWLQSLAYWEPRARRRHHTLLKRYLGARACAAPHPRAPRAVLARRWMQCPRGGPPLPPLGSRCGSGPIETARGGGRGRLRLAENHPPGR